MEMDFWKHDNVWVRFNTDLNTTVFDYYESGKFCILRLKDSDGFKGTWK
jgi:hypothetical protein